jgi:hypothetical protein
MHKGSFSSNINATSAFVPIVIAVTYTQFKYMLTGIIAKASDTRSENPKPSVFTISI